MILVLDLKDVDDNCDNKNKVIMLLHAMPKAYEQLKNTLKYSKESLTLRGIIEAICGKELKLKNSGKDMMIRKGVSIKDRCKKEMTNLKNHCRLRSKYIRKTKSWFFLKRGSLKENFS